MRSLNILHVPNTLDRHRNRPCPQHIQQRRDIRHIRCRVPVQRIESRAPLRQQVQIPGKKLQQRTRRVSWRRALVQRSLVIPEPDERAVLGEDGVALIEALEAKRVKHGVRTAQGLHLLHPVLVAVDKGDPALAPNVNMVPLARGAVYRRALQLRKLHEREPHGAAHPVHEYPLALGHPRRVHHHTVRGIPVADERRRLAVIHAVGHADAVLLGLVDQLRFGVVLGQDGDDVADLEVLGALAEGADGADEAVAWCEGRFLHEGVNALAHVDVCAGEARVFCGDLDFAGGRWGADICDDFDHVDVAVLGDDDFPDARHCGGWRKDGGEDLTRLEYNKLKRYTSESRSPREKRTPGDLLKHAKNIPRLLYLWACYCSVPMH